jgi:ribosomal protein S24E
MLLSWDKMNIIKDTKNDLLKRREVKLVMNADKNPGLAAAAKVIAEQLKVPEDTIVVKTLKSKFGRDTFLIDSCIYNSKEDKERIEFKKREKKTEGAAAPAGGK